LLSNYSTTGLKNLKNKNMMTITLILVAITIGYFCLTLINSGSNKEVDFAKSQLSEILDKLFFSIPLYKLMDDEKESQLSVKFTVNEYYELTNLIIQGENEKLVKYAHSKLSEEITKYVDEIEPSKYDVDLRFVLN
jgi:hypothetical protein